MNAAPTIDLAIDEAGTVHDLGWWPNRARCGAALPADALFSSRAPVAVCAECARFRDGHEVAITWAVDPIAAELDYVRVWHVWSPRRHGRPRWDFAHFELLGWADLGRGARAHHGRFQRRVFALMPHDRRPGVDGEYYRPSGAPAEAVDPRTLGPNAPGIRTARAWGEQ